MKQYIKTTTFDVICEFENCFIDLDGNVFPFEQSNFETISNILYNNLSENKRKLNNISISDCLIIQGYVLVKQLRVHYYLIPNNIQCKLIGCIWYNGSLIDRYNNKAQRIIKNRIRQKFFN